MKQARINVSRPRIYQPFTLTQGASIKLDDKAAHHVARVLRAKVGDALVLFNGQGGEYESVIEHIDKRGVEVFVSAFVDRERESPLSICLAQGLARGEKMDFIVQKAVELGVTQIMPLITERCNVRLEGEREEKRLNHWQSVAISACEQCGRNRVPVISAPLTLKAWLPAAQAHLSFVLSPHVRATFTEEALPAGASVILLIGPEGGLSDQEVELALQNGFLPLSLGPRILRTETAAMAAMATLQYRYGDFHSKTV